MVSSVKPENPSATSVPPLDETARFKGVEKALGVLHGLGLSKRKATMGQSNTIFDVPASGGNVRADLSRTRPEDVLLDILDAVWKDGVSRGRALQDTEQTEALLQAFPSLREVMRGVAEEAIEADRAYRGEE